MLTIIVPGVDLFDEETNEFIEIEDTRIDLEHSLVSLSKWESKWEKPFLSATDKTTEQVLDYIKTMCLTPEVDPQVFLNLSASNYDDINAYMVAKMTATWFSDKAKASRSSKVITAELIYYWMIESNIPFECQHWHIERLFTLIKVCSSERAPEKKMSKADLIARNRALNEQRKAQMGTAG